MKYSPNKINMFIGLQDQKHFINEYKEHCDIIKKLNHVEKWLVATVRINLAQK